MNLRYYNNDSTLITRLAHQAHEQSNIIYNDRIKTEHAAYVIFYDIFNQQFAELIIKECASICNERAITAPMGSDEQYEADDCASAIMKRFGDDK